MKLVMKKKIISGRLWLKVEKYESTFLYSLHTSNAGQEAVDDGKPRIFSFGRSYLSRAPQHDYSTYLKVGSFLRVRTFWLKHLAFVTFLVTVVFRDPH